MQLIALSNQLFIILETRLLCNIVNTNPLKMSVVYQNILIFISIIFTIQII